MAFIDIIGQRFGRLVAIKALGADSRRQIQWSCQCDCGGTAIVPSGRLRGGDTKSCGCLHNEGVAQRMTKHGGCGTRIYRIWANMRERCERPGKDAYYRYGARGIKVCDEWQDFSKFREWALVRGYADDLSIDRIDNDGPYSPDNCRWATRLEQARNTAKNMYLTYRSETLALSAWSERTGIGYSTIRKRLELGWTIDKALETPVRRRQQQSEAWAKIGADR